MLIGPTRIPASALRQTRQVRLPGFPPVPLGLGGRVAGRDDAAPYDDNVGAAHVDQLARGVVLLAEAVAVDLAVLLLARWRQLAARGHVDEVVVGGRVEALLRDEAHDEALVVASGIDAGLRVVPGHEAAL